MSLLTYLFKYGFVGFWHRVCRDNQYEPVRVTKLWYATHKIHKLYERPALPSLSELLTRFHIRASNSVAVFLTQIWGGGADMYLRKRISEESSRDITIVVSPSRYSRELQADVYRYGELIFEYILPRLEALYSLKGKVCDITINSLVQWHLLEDDGIISNRFLHNCVNQIISLKENLCARVTYLVHDYNCICPKMALVDDAYRYCNSEYSMVKCPECIRKSKSVFIIEPGISLAQWRVNFYHLLSACDEVRTFSGDTYNRIAKIYDKLPLTIVPHSLLTTFQKTPKISCDAITVGVFGGLSKIKGSMEILALSRYLYENGHHDVKIVVVGSLNDVVDFSCYPNIRNHGPYKIVDLPTIIEAERINVGLVPSVCPETFSYVTHELIALGLPVVSFDIGAQADAVKKYDKGTVAKEMTPEAVWNAIEQLYAKSRY